MRVERHPVLTVFGHLKHPVAQGGAAIPTGVTESVSRGNDPQTEVNCKPGVFIVVRVAVESGAVSAQDVFESAVRQVPALGGGHHD